jgi:hypothetical protein
VSFSQLVGLMVSAGFAAFGEPVTVTPRGGGSVPASAIISRGAEVLDDYGVLVDSRIEIEILRSETESVDRGTLVFDGASTFTLLEPISDDGEVSRWIASEA